MRQSSRTILISVLVLCALAGIAFFWATAMVDSIYAFRSPISGSPPAAIESMGNPLTRRVVIVLVDALRLDTAENAEIMPTLHRLSTSGASATMHSQTPSFSAPGYSTLLTGAWPYLNDGPAFNLEYEDIPSFTQDQLFAAASRAGLKTAVSGYYWFEKLIPPDQIAYSFYTPGEDRDADEEVVAHALPWLDDPSIKLVLIHIDQVDYAGHYEGGPANAAWDEAAYRSDELIARIAGKLDFNQDTILIISDHGQIDSGGHGGPEPVVLTEPFVLHGAGVRPGQFPDMQMVDVSPTLSVLLGLSLPASAQGVPLLDMLEVSIPDQAAYQQEQAELQGNLTSLYARSIDMPDVTTGPEAISTLRQMRLGKERIARAIIPLAFLLGMTFLFWTRKTRLAATLFASAVFLLVFNLRYILLDGKSYSFSTIESPTSLIIYIAVTAGAALALASLVYLWMNWRKDANPAQTIQSMLWFIICLDCLLLISPMIHAWWNGILPTWTLPDFGIYFSGLFFLIQILVVSILGILIAFLSGGIRRFTKKKISSE